MDSEHHPHPLAGYQGSIVGVASVAVTGLLTVMLTAWSSPGTNLGRFGTAMFAERGVAPLGYAAFAFAAGVTAGVLIRRTLPAMAATLVAFLAARIIVQNWVRPHLATPLKLSQAPLTPKRGARPSKTRRLGAIRQLRQRRRPRRQQRHLPRPHRTSEASNLPRPTTLPSEPAWPDTTKS